VRSLEIFSEERQAHDHSLVVEAARGCCVLTLR
jgi:hypothetical protein